jgi:hypothetical protein
MGHPAKLGLRSSTLEKRDLRKFNAAAQSGQASTYGKMTNSGLLPAPIP